MVGYTSIMISSYSLYQFNMMSYVNVRHLRAQGELSYHLIEVPWFKNGLCV